VSFDRADAFALDLRIVGKTTMSASAEHATLCIDIVESHLHRVYGVTADGSWISAGTQCESAGAGATTGFMEREDKRNRGGWCPVIASVAPPVVKETPFVGFAE